MLAGLLVVPAFSAPQSDSRAPAQPGTVNYIEGQASIGGQSLDQNSVGTALQIGQTLETQNGRAEILLTPGVFLRVDHNSAITMDAGDLANIHLTLQRGRAIAEVDQIFKDNNIAIAVGGANARLIKSGLYEFDTNLGIRTFDGQVKVEVNGKQIDVDGGHQLALNTNDKLKAHGFDKKSNEDDFYRWASLRSSYLAEANVNTARLYANGGPGWYGQGWYWSPWYSAYTWLPGDGIFWDPFGWGFFAPGFVGYAPYYGYGFGYAPFYGGRFGNRFGPGYHPQVMAHGALAGQQFRGGAAGGFGGGGFHGAAVGGGFHGGGGGFHGGGGGGHR